MEIEPTNIVDEIEELDTQDEADPILDIIDYLVRQKEVCFKSQQIGESELSNTEKKQIAYDLFKKGKNLFIAKYGIYLTDAQLDYFKKSDDYELNYRIMQLKTMLIDKNRQTLKKNRRYEALLKLIKENSYFSEIEMMRRNPLLYEQLVGRYLSESEKSTRDNLDTQNITLLNVLMESMDRQITRDVLEKQKCKEESQMEEDSSDDNESDISESSDDKEHVQWGEYTSNKIQCSSSSKEQSIPFVTAVERSLFRDEFTQEMYRSFLAGEDDIDYDAIDNNPEYDGLEVRDRDEEEKYFDSETPEDLEDKPVNEMSVVSNAVDKDESEDELDVFMRHLNEHPALKDVSRSKS